MICDIHNELFVHFKKIQSLLKKWLAEPQFNPLSSSDAYASVDLVIIGSDNGLSPGRRQTIIWAKAGILLIGAMGTNFYKILVEIYIFSLKNSFLKCHQDVGGDFVSVSVW